MRVSVARFFILGVAAIFEKCKVELVAFLSGSCRLRWSISFLIRLINGRFIHNLLIFVKKQKFGSWRRNSSSMALVRCVKNICLLAEESVALINNILDNFWSGSPIFNPKRAVYVGLVDRTHLLVVLLWELSDTVLAIRSMRDLLVVFLDT